MPRRATSTLRTPTTSSANIPMRAPLRPKRRSRRRKPRSPRGRARRHRSGTTSYYALPRKFSPAARNWADCWRVRKARRCRKRSAKSGARGRYSTSSPARRSAFPARRWPACARGSISRSRAKPSAGSGSSRPGISPTAFPAWKIAPALAFGNPVVFKPADLVPGCAHALAEIIVRAGAPKGVFNLVMGRGSVVGQAMLDHPKVDAITFTGSVATGRRVAEACTKRMRKIQLEKGGKNPLVVLDDADLKIAVEVAVNGAYFSTGQRCTASSRLIVTAGVYARFADALAERMRGLVVDDAVKPGVHIGPVVDQTQL